MTTEHTDPPFYTVSFANGPRYDLDQIRRRQEAFMPDGENLWVLHAAFAVEDPERDLVGMVLGAGNFVGVSANIYCLLCGVVYRSKIRHYKCPQREVPA